MGFDLSKERVTHFEFYTRSPEALAELIEKAVDDALQSKGCSLDLRLPDNDTGLWADWLVEDVL